MKKIHRGWVILLIGVLKRQVPKRSEFKQTAGVSLSLFPAGYVRSAQYFTIGTKNIKHDYTIVPHYERLYDTGIAGVNTLF
ncbi:hypothetical protein EV207_15016 [Scopulibacillus darangshiensis]|uniref:Uncharacterized protein n=1 Tax=Scopulibacillus darangshiensis TaxID=442528 RepID=A0A4R2NH38_9BACL|nr:hypothetical protein [Scopulibacillus darangshiensis]TCP20713.1 hypothetical protein EV207_15016 [Scopulibacillus darangshiensis]